MAVLWILVALNQIRSDRLRVIGAAVAAAFGAAAVLFIVAGGLVTVPLGAAGLLGGVHAAAIGAALLFLALPGSGRRARRC